MENNTSKYYYEVDVLRGLACLMVFFAHCPIYRLFHAEFNFSGTGGVRLFFVISGFIITLGLNIKAQEKFSTIEDTIVEGFKQNRINIYNFWYRRFIRLFPGLCLFFGSISIVLLYLGVRNGTIFSSLMAVARFFSLFLFGENTKFLMLPISMFHDWITSMGGGLVWTLNCEILFYLSMPFFLLHRSFKKFLPFIWLAFFVIKSIAYIFFGGR